MRKLKRILLTFLVIATYIIGAQAQVVELNEEKVPFKIDDTEFVSKTKDIKSDPMVIGPDLYNQMGEVSTYYALNVAYTYDDYEDYTGYSADDFLIPTGDNWDIKYVRFTMYSPFLTDSISYFNVIVYSDLAGKPDTIIKELVKQTNIYYETRSENAGMHDITVTLSENISLTEGKYWITAQPVTDIVEPNAYDDPSFWAGNMLQVKADAINSQSHMKNPGKGYYPLSEWSSMTTYWNKMQGVDYGFYNLNFAIYGPAKDKDLAITSINTPETGAGLTNAEDVMVTIQNHGLTDVEDDEYTIRFRVNQGTWFDVDNGKAVPSGAEILFTMHVAADLSDKGIHNIEVEIIYADDENNDNDILDKTIENYGILYPAVPDTKVVYTTCEGTFTDHGGLGNIIEAYSHDTVVFIPGTEGSRIRLEFYDTEMSGAYPFRFYNGSSTNAPELGNWEALNNSEGIYTQEIHGLVLEGTNPEGAITIIIPGFDINSSSNNFLANVTCVKNENTDFTVTGIQTNKPYSWENETIELTALLESRGLVTGSALVTFFVDGTELSSTVSTTIMEYGQTGTSKTFWTPTAAGTYEITAKVPADDGLYSDEKEFTIEHEIYPAGYLVEGFELEKYPPEGWETRVQGGTSRYFIWYNDRPHWEGKWQVSINMDTLITPKLDISETDTIEFIYSAGFFGGTCSIIYAPTLDGPWKVAHTVSYGLPFAIEYKASLWRAEGANYIGFAVQGGSIDFIRGAKLHIAEYNLSAIEFTGPIDPQINTEVNYDFKIRNMGDGTLSGSDYSVKLWKEIDEDATEIASLQGVNISFSNYHTFSFEHTFTTVESGNIYATIDYTADEETSNNASESLNLSVIKAGVEYVLQGSMESKLFDRGTIAGYGANYAEIIYHKDSLDINGEISGISIYYDNTYSSDVKMQIYMGETELENLEDGFLSTSAMHLVANTIIELEFTDEPYVQVYIPFDVPYLYSGEKNLVLGFYRPAIENDEHMWSVFLQATQRDANVIRYHAMQMQEKDTDVSDPNEINALTYQLGMYVPNMMFYIKTTEMDASLTGTVTNEIPDSLSGVTISLKGFANTTKTDVDGKYSFPVMPYGDVNVMAEFYGYYNDTITGTFTAANETVVNFTIKALPTVEVTGNIIANDSLKPIAGVEVYMTGYNMEFYEVTDAEGNFTITGVFAAHDYDLTFTHIKYAEHTKSITVPVEGLNIGTITLDELEVPAFNILANITETGLVDVEWQTPHTGVKGMVDPTLGTGFGSFWYNEPDEDVQLGNLFRVTKPGTVTSLELSNYAWASAQAGELYLRFYNKDREEILKPIAFTMPDSTVDWMEIPVPNFTYTEDFYVMVHWNKIHQQTSAIMSHKHDDNVAYLIDGSGSWMLLTDLVGMTHSGAFSLRANVLEEGNGETKALISYNLWRTEIENSPDPDLWEKMNTEPLAGTSFTDETFNTAADGYYMYVVQAVYTNDDSPYSYSNSINKGVFVDVTVNVTANNSQDITGTRVNFVHDNGAAINTYYAEVANGKVEFLRALKGNYEISIFNGSGYEVFEANYTIVNDTTINVELEEIIITPSMLSVYTDEVNKIAKFSWIIGDTITYKNDAGNFDYSVAPNLGFNTGLGNYFDVDDSGDIYAIEIRGVANDGNEGGKVRIVIYDADEEILGKSAEFVIQPDSFLLIETPLIAFNGSFYAMVEWNEDETLGTHWLAFDISAEANGGGYVRGDDNGFTELTYNGSLVAFGVRVKAVIGSKKSIITNTNTETKVIADISDNTTLNVNSGAAYVAEPKGIKSVLSYNVFLNDELVADGVTGHSFTFNENDHLTVEGVNTYKAGVQAVFTTGNSIIVPIDFEYNHIVDTIGVVDNIDAKLVLYPNPATNNITISHTENSTIEIYSAVGKLVKTVTNNSTISTISVATLPNGTYIVKVVFDEGNVYRNMIINR